MNAQQSPLHGLLDPSDSARIKHALAGSASRRGALSPLVAADMPVGIAGAMAPAAESSASQDGESRVLVLRKFVEFHDGKPLTPADVVFSIRRHKEPATVSKAKALAGIGGPGMTPDFVLAIKHLMHHDQMRGTLLAGFLGNNLEKMRQPYE